MVRIENWKEYRAQFNTHAKKIVASMSLEEKVSLMSGTLSLEEILGSIRKKSRKHYNEIPYVAGDSDKVPPVKFVDGSRGVVCAKGIYTCFPVASLRGATFNKQLEKEVGIAIGEEVIMAGGNLYGGVCLNIPYHPGWGRSQETYGEDTVHVSKMGKAIIEGVQSTGVIVGVKHFAFNSMENIRREVNVICDKTTGENIFLKQFEEAVKAGAGAVMTSYNSYNGEKCGQNRYLINDVLREKWGFDGFTLCDFTWGITDTKKAVWAGQDIEMPNTHFYGQRLIDAVENGEIPEESVNVSAIRIARTILAHEALINERRLLIKNILKLMDEHRVLAKKVALEGITLLKNEGVLPLKCKGIKSKILILGKLADEANTGDRGSSQVYPPYVITPLEGIIKSSQRAEVIYYNGDNLNHCKRLAKDVDAVIVVTGNDYMVEGERISSEVESECYDGPGGDRTGPLRIQTEDQNIIKAVSEIRQDTVVLLTGGNAIVVDDFIDDIGALLFCYYPGMEGGNAIGEILFGDANPSGKLPFIIPKNESDLQIINWKGKQQIYDYFHGYTLLDKKGIKPRFDYGFGLSYSKFEIKQKSKEIVGTETIITVEIKNAGDVAGAEVIKLFRLNKVIDNKLVKRELVDFEKVFLKPNETKYIKLSVRALNIDEEYAVE